MIQNQPFTKSIIKQLPKGFTPSCQPLGRNEKGEMSYLPNRKGRRAIKQKGFGKPLLPVERRQFILVKDKETGKATIKTIIHYKTPLKSQ